MFQPRPIGWKHESEMKVAVCRECGGIIDITGCSYGCGVDAPVSERKPGTYVTRTYKRVDTLIKEEPGK